MTIKALYPTIKPSLMLDFANTEALDPRITFNRTTTARYYDGKTTTKAEENLFLQSQFASGWINFGTNSITADNATAPDGTTTAALVSSPATGDYVWQAPATTIGLTYVFSFFVKNSTATISHCHVRASSTAAFAFLTWSGSTLSSVTATSGTFSFVDVGNGWYRVSGVYTATETAARHRIGGGDSVSTTGDIFIWGAQLEQRSAVTAYTPTTTQPITNYIPVLQTAAAGVARFDHNPTTGESLGLLIEEQRTNLLVQSEDFANAAWGTSNSSITSNTIVAPDGTLTGDKLVENTANSLHLISRSSPVTITANTNHTFSCYIKAAERTKVILRFAKNGTPFTNNNALFDLSAVTATTSSSGFATTNTPTITAVGNGWYRCTMGGVLDASSTDGAFQIRLVDASNNTTYTGDGYSGIYIWGAQLEAGAFPTSYIPTVAATVTRNADVASMTGANFSSWYRADEGTLYSEHSSARSTFQRVFDLSDGTTSNSINIFATNSAGNGTAIGVTTSGVFQGSSPSTIATASGVLYKVAGGYKVNDLNGARNGTIGTVDTSVILPVLDRAFIGGGVSAANNLNGTIRKLSFYPARLSDAQLQALTTV